MHKILCYYFTDCEIIQYTLICMASSTAPFDLVLVDQKYSNKTYTYLPAADIVGWVTQICVIFWIYGSSTKIWMIPVCNTNYTLYMTQLQLK